jgi:hydrogenase maturation protease
MKISVLGIGNLLLRDEGVGVHAVTALKEGYAFRPEIGIIDGGTMGLDLLPYLQDQEKIVVIDATDFGEEPGCVRVLEGRSVYLSQRGRISVHNLGLSDLLFGLTLACDRVPEVYLVGVQPESIEMGPGLTGTLQRSMGRVLEEAVRLLDSWGIECRCHAPYSAEGTMLPGMADGRSR